MTVPFYTPRFSKQNIQVQFRKELDSRLIMADDEFTDINGKPLSLEYRFHSSFCREFIVSAPKVSLLKVMVYTCMVWLFAYAVFFVTEVRWFTSQDAHVMMLLSTDLSR